MNSRRLEGKVALVTGVSIGIGRAIAIALVREGARVLGTGRSMQRLQDTVNEIAAIGGEFVPVEADAAVAADVERSVQECLNRFGRIDILVNNAGILQRGGILSTTEETYDQVMDVNVKGTFLYSKAVAPHMIGQGSGNIINIAGGVAVRPNMNAVYSASKAAMVALTKAAALELSPKGIRVNVINPGPIATEMTLPSWNDPERGPIIRKRSLLGRIADPAEVAAGVVFLASDEASFITAAEIPIDAGWVLA